MIPPKHADTAKAQRTKLNVKRKKRSANKRKNTLVEMIDKIKSASQIVNLTEIELPDCVYLYLSKVPLSLQLKQINMT